MKLGLGTAQFGLDYGISNRRGQTPAEEVSLIFAAARKQGLQMIDTAASYGNSEVVLGATLPVGHQFKIVTKTPPFRSSIGRDSAKRLEEIFHGSLRRMKVSSVYGLMIHDAGDLISDEGPLLMDRLLMLRDRGLVSKIGVSVYRTDQIDNILDRFAIDIIQVPVNVLDQRLLRSGHLKKLKKAGVEIHARSAFLQGLLLMDPARVPDYFFSILDHVKKYHEWIKSRRLSPVQAALGFVMGLEDVDYVICGVNDLKHFEELCGVSPLSDSQDFSKWAIDDPMMVDPSRWKPS